METLVIHGPEDALVLIPHLLGYYPRHHLVLLGLDELGVDATGKRACMGPIVTINLEPPESAAEAPAESAEHDTAAGDRRRRFDDAAAQPMGWDADLHETDCCADAKVSDAGTGAQWPYLEAGYGLELAQIVREYGVQRCVLALYCSDVVSFLHGPEAATLRGICYAIREAAPQADLLMAMLADSDQWCVFDEPEPELHARDELATREIALQLIAQGSAPLEEPPVQTISRANRSALRLAAQAGEKWLAAEENHFVAGCKLWNEILQKDGTETIAERGRANVALHDFRVRDRVLLYAVADDDGGLVDLDEDSLAFGLIRAAHRVPDIERLEKTRALLERCAAVAPADDACALAASGYLAWWSGRNSIAHERVKAAMDIDPSHSLVRILAQTLAFHVLPPWMARCE
ncbi:MAG: DUF4192 family protein [Actinomycetaceae bacterium]|nr:DUF4192 family protein [Actinomycetaceae bacterium]